MVLPDVASSTTFHSNGGSNYGTENGLLLDSDSSKIDSSESANGSETHGTASLQLISLKFRMGPKYSKCDCHIAQYVGKQINRHCTQVRASI